MNNKYEKDIYERSYQFAISVVKLSRKLPRNVESDVLTKQAIRSSTSIAANLEEANGSKTRQEFRHSASISKKEAKETKLWLRMISDLYPEVSQEASALIAECEEIIKILSTIVIKTQ